MTNATSNNLEWVAHVVIMPIILFVGFFGQLLNLITLHQPRLKGITFMYLKAVAFAQFFSILAVIPSVIRHAYENVDAQWPCWSLFYSAHFEVPLASAFMAANALSIVGLTVERYISVCHPLWALKASSPKRARMIIVALYIVAFALFVPATLQKRAEYAPKNKTGTFELHQEVGAGACEVDIIARNDASRGQEAFKIYALLREILVRVGPVLVLIILNIAIFQTMRRTSSKRRRLVSMKRLSSRRRSSRRRPGFVKQPTVTGVAARSGSRSGAGSGIESQPSSSMGNGNQSNANGDPSAPQSLTPSAYVSYSDNRTLVIRYRRTRREKNDRERQRRLHVLLVITVLTFLFCTTPAGVLSLWVTDRSTAGDESLAFRAFSAAASLLEVISFSINFYIYCLRSEDYRKIFLKWVHRCSDEIYRFIRER